MILMNEQFNDLSQLKKTKGSLIVFTGPSGVGKGTIVKELFKDIDNLEFSISVTTRPRREEEKDGINYFFKTRDEFEKLIKNDQLLEYAEFVGNYYGTPRDFVEAKLNNGKDVFLVIEVQGALQIKKKFPEAVMIFLLPPSFDELEDRLRKRRTEDEKTVQKRLSKAKSEMNQTKEFNYVVINDEVHHAADLVRSIILAERCKTE